MKKKTQFCIVLAALLLVLTACSGNEPQAPYTDETVLPSSSLEQEQNAIHAQPAIPDILKPEASGTLVQENETAVVDYSNHADGYVMAQYKTATDKKLKVQVKGPATTYTYNIIPQKWDTFPLSDGNGAYKVSVFENVEGTKYALVQSISFDAALRDEFAPFLRPNQYVDYADAVQTIRKAAELTAGKTETLDKVQAVYSYVVENISYDKELAASVKSGYLPDLDAVLESKAGICFDYAALMTGMLRSQSVPCKLVVGYAGEAYHAWISVYSEKDGWIDNAIYFDGTAWKRMDPTFASSANQSKDIMEYIGDGANYTEKYLY